MDRIKIFEWAYDEFGSKPEYLFEKYPNFAVLRNTGSKKWFAVFMNIPREKLGLEGADEIEVINVKCDPIIIGSLRMQRGYYPAYHMNKNYWVSIANDGTVSDDEIKSLISLSHDLTEKKMRRRKKYEE